MLGIPQRGIASLSNSSSPLFFDVDQDGMPQAIFPRASLGTQVDLPTAPTRRERIPQVEDLSQQLAVWEAQKPTPPSISQ